MAQPRTIELRVGIFVLVSLVVVAGLVLKFSKSTWGTKSSYDITVIFPNVSGIVRDASVLYAGIPVGRVKDIRLKEEETLTVHLTLAIFEGVVIRRDARIVVNTSGLLGDRYVDILPGSSTSEPLRPGDTITGAPSVDLTEAIRQVVDVLKAAASAIQRVDKAIQRIDETVFSQGTLDHVSGALANIDAASTNAVGLIASLRDVVSENRTNITAALTNFERASQNLTTTTKRLDELVLSNQDEVGLVLSNLVASTERVEAVLSKMEKGEGTVGKLMTDPTLYNEVVQLVQNWRRFGLLYKEGRAGKPAAPATSDAPRGKPVVPARPAKAP